MKNIIIAKGKFIGGFALIPKQACKILDNNNAGKTIDNTILYLISRRKL